MEVSRKVEKKWAAFVPNKTKQNIWSKQAMLHWTHCYITRVLHQRPLIHWANLTLALRSQSTQREQFICAFKCWVWSEPNQIFFARWDLYTCCCWLYNTSEREQVPQRPLPTPVLTVTTKQQPVGWHQHNRGKLCISCRRHLRLTSKQSRRPYVFKWPI